MPKAIHESLPFNSRNREVAIHCVFSVKDNTHCVQGFSFFIISQSSSAAEAAATHRPVDRRRESRVHHPTK